MTKLTITLFLGDAAFGENLAEVQALFSQIDVDAARGDGMPRSLKDPKGHVVGHYVATEV